MTYQNEEFKFYQMPYRHNIKNYLRFNSYSFVNYLEYDYYPYLISNPYLNESSKIKNIYKQKVAIIVKNKLTKKLSLEFEEFDFNSILSLNMYTRIRKDGSVKLFEDIEKRFSSLIYEMSIKIDDVSNCKKMSLKEVINTFNIFNKVEIDKQSEFANLEFYLYEIDNKCFLISAMEILKYFYLYNYSKTITSNFCSNILSTSGIYDSINDFTQDKDFINILINGNYSEQDRYKILFFLSDKNRLEQYSQVFFDYKNNNAISSKIPLDSVNMKTRVFHYKSKNLYYVLNIIDHDKTNDFKNIVNYSYQHVKAKEKPKLEDKRYLQSNEVETNLSSNDDDYGNAKAQYNKKANEYIDNNIEFKRTNSSTNLKGKKELLNNDLGHKWVLIQEKKDIEMAMTTKKSIGLKSNSVSIKERIVDENLEKEESKISLNKLIKSITYHKSFETVDIKSFIYPKVYTDNGTEKKKSFMFQDHDKHKRKRYKIAHLKYKEEDLFLVELESQYNGISKPLLIIFENNLCSDKIDEIYIKKELVLFAKEHNKMWFADRKYSNLQYTTYNHNGYTGGLINKIEKCYKGYHT